MSRDYVYHDSGESPRGDIWLRGHRITCSRHLRKNTIQKSELRVDADSHHLEDSQDQPKKNHVFSAGEDRQYSSSSSGHVACVYCAAHFTARAMCIEARAQVQRCSLATAQRAAHPFYVQSAFWVAVSAGSAACRLPYPRISRATAPKVEGARSVDIDPTGHLIEPLASIIARTDCLGNLKMYCAFLTKKIYIDKKKIPTEIHDSALMPAWACKKRSRARMCIRTSSNLAARAVSQIPTSCSADPPPIRSLLSIGVLYNFSSNQLRYVIYGPRLKHIADNNFLPPTFWSFYFSLFVIILRF
ncbi:unnamed protein product [Trichogramma brassicae]|uniref:Uncharacterized protein n=1 Tax=Trichogramma brassicae TaxID=86971 RepID=A0A6H5HWD2_9HYME|nr:unnamed protein product [Trichogramma brassicae]